MRPQVSGRTGDGGTIMKSDWDRLYGSGGDAAPGSSGVNGHGPDSAGANGHGAAAGGEGDADAAWSRLTELVDRAGDSPQVPVAAAFGMLPSAQEGAHAALVSELADLHAGNGDPDALLDAFRASLVMVPTLDGGDLWATSMGGVHWVYAFSDDTELARFAVARGADGSSGVDYVTVYGWRLLDEVVPAVGEPAGVALDVAGSRPMIFPPVVGVVPDRAAVDAVAGNGEER
ncbi:conserved hypothetical protein [Actinacidiphila cocklensis]|uniref:SseB protein N-terminal domain-containing protein n=2 Tax=Actinacidiphila cocklensis TaxID=887465 RepID=A0A9W4EAF1_9ACTN|nr:conserved hypothetical protein [Actinacidiphila cocklensis]